MHSTPRAAVLFAIAFSVSAASAAERGAPAEARAMLEKASKHYAEAGREKALADFSAGKPPFKDRDLYVVCISADHRIAANGAFAGYVGMSADILKDAAGHPLGAAIYDSAAKGDGKVGYPMLNPVTRRTEPKVIFTRKLGGDVCGVGAYGS